MLNYTLMCGKMSCRLSNHTMHVHFKHNYTLLTKILQIKQKKKKITATATITSTIKVNA